MVREGHFIVNQHTITLCRSQCRAVKSLSHAFANELTLIAIITVTIAALGVFCLVVCKFLLRFRIREIINKSIIDNIREL